MPTRISIYHNILWSKYKGAVFSKLHRLLAGSAYAVSFIQIAETESDRQSIGSVDLSYHQYPYRLLFPASYDAVSAGRRVSALVSDLVRNPADLVVLPGFHRVEYWAMLLTCMLLGRRRVVFCDSTLADNPRRGWKQFAKRVFFSRCDGFLAYGIRSKEFLMSYGVPEHKIGFRCQAAALPPGYRPESVIEQYDSQMAQGATANRFLFVGRLAAEKGLDDLLAAVQILRAKDATICVDVVGDGPLRESLQRRIGELGLQGTVTLLGSKGIEDIGVLFTQSIALVLPSHSEPWGLVVNEALSYGCPVVVSDVCGCVPELVQPGVTGFVYPTGNAEALANAMEQAMGLSRAGRPAVARACIELISNFSPGKAALQILDRCERVISGRT